MFLLKQQEKQQQKHQQDSTNISTVTPNKPSRRQT